MTEERSCQVVEEGGAARADVRVEGGDGEDAEAVQRLLRGLRHLRQDALKKNCRHWRRTCEETVFRSGKFKSTQLFLSARNQCHVTQSKTSD